MDPEEEGEISKENRFCPNCGTEQSGYFCRTCGALLRGQERLLCPRCHAVVAGGDFCPRCGQGLKGMALTLQQLALAGEDFWLTGSEPPLAAGSQPASTATWEPDEQVVLADPEIPHWLRELPTDKAPVEVQERIYPALYPVIQQPGPRQESRFLTLAVLLMGLMLVGLIALAVFLLAQFAG